MGLRLKQGASKQNVPVNQNREEGMTLRLRKEPSLAHARTRLRLTGLPKSREKDQSPQVLIKGMR